MAPSTDNTDMGGIPFKILIVDDDEDDRIILDEAFTEMGYAAEVKKFITRDALFNYLDHIDVALMPSVIVLDYVLGRVTALDVLKDLKKDIRYSTVPVIINSSSIPAFIQEKLLKEGACAVVEKGTRLDAIRKFARSLKEFANYNKTELIAVEDKTLTYIRDFPQAC